MPSMKNDFPEQDAAFRELMSHGVTRIPLIIWNNYRHVSMTPTEFALWEAIIETQNNEQLPCPTIASIAASMQLSMRTIQRYIKRLQEKHLLTVIPGSEPYKPNSYDFTPFYDAVIAMNTLRKTRKAKDR